MPFDFELPRPEATDVNPARRPGVPRLAEPKPWPNSVWPIPRQRGEPAARMLDLEKPVFGTTLPPHGPAGAIRKAAYRIPDDEPRHWLVLMLGDRVDVWSHRARKLAPLALPAAAFFGVRRLRASRGRAAPMRPWRAAAQMP